MAPTKTPAKQIAPVKDNTSNTTPTPICCCVNGNNGINAVIPYITPAINAHRAPINMQIYIIIPYIVAGTFSTINDIIYIQTFFVFIFY